MSYKLPCSSCGSYVSIETNQAGRQIECSCGNQLQAPMLSQITKLEPVGAEEQKTRQATGRSVPSKSSRPIQIKYLFMGLGLAFFLVTVFLFTRGAAKYPQLHDVCMINSNYRHGDKIIGRNSQPISPRDFRLLVDERVSPPYYLIWSEDTINTLPYIDYHPIYLLEMHDHLKGGLELSYNFNEKYSGLVFYYWARFVIFGVLVIVSLVIFIVGIFLPRQTEEIGERGGESWS